jgi:hypothetical protein
MELLTNITLCAIGLMVLQAGKKLEEFDESATKKKPEKYSYEYCREKLRTGYYTDWNCQDIAKQLTDNWVRADVDFLMRYGYTFEYAIDTLIEDGVIKL